MSLVCLTDFSAPAMQACLSAARLASRFKRRLHLVHATGLTDELHGGASFRARRAWSEAHLTAQLAELQRYADRVEAHMLHGQPTEAVLELLTRVAASLLVIAAGDRLATHPRSLSPLADELARATPIPLLVVRDPPPFEGWFSRAQPLRVVIAVRSWQVASSALELMRRLAKLGPLAVTVLQVRKPLTLDPGEPGLAGVTNVSAKSEPRMPDVVPALALPLLLEPGWTFRQEPQRFARVVDDVCVLASATEASLLVVAAPATSRTAECWPDSTTRAILRRGLCSVVCVPESAGADSTSARKPSVVLAATDFSRSGNAAVALAYGLVQPGGVVHLLHVLPGRSACSYEQRQLRPSPRDDERSARRALEALVRRVQGVPASSTRVHTVRGDGVAALICEAAEVLGAHALCLGTGEHAGRADPPPLGSVAQEVVSSSRRQVLFAQHGPTQA